MNSRLGIVASFGLVATSATADVLNVPADYPTIQSAIAAAVAGDEVLVAAGTYFEAIDLLGKAVTLRGAAGAESTIIDGTGLDTSVIRCASGEGAETLIAGFTITRGVAGSPIPGQPGFRFGGGLFVKDASPTIEACRFIDNRAGFGGGAYFLRSESVIRDCLFHDNLANTDGGGAQFFDGAVSIEDCMFTLNKAPQGHGGGAHFVIGLPTVTDCTFSNNNATVGGGFSFFTNGSAMAATGLAVNSNIASGTGGGIWLNVGADQLLLSGSEVCSNFPNPISGDYIDLGKNLFCTGCPGDLNNNGIIDGADISVMLGFWGFSGIGIPVPADLDNDGVVSGSDLATLLSNWGSCGS